jgi:hypothetical protein
LILAMTKMRKRNSRNKKPVLISFANSWKKSLVTKLKNAKLVKESMTPPVYLLLVNMVGLLIWKESWRLKPWGIPQWDLIWYPKRLWKSTPTIQLSSNLKKDLNKTNSQKL